MTAARVRSDRHWMEQALALASLGEGTTSPNPRVGCVVVRADEVVGQGFHRAAGLPHAEAQALAEAGDRARDATLFVNLEPCAHHGRTPPCADLVARCGVRRVVASVEDPDPRVSGRGLRTLREAGVHVETGLLSSVTRRLNAPFFHWHATGRPLVTLKAALSIDGRISAKDGRAKWISGPGSRRFAHRLRFGHDAVLVGAGTIRGDDPLLTVRLPGIVAPKIRAVLSPDLRIDPEARVFRPLEGSAPRTRVYVARTLAARAARPFVDRAEIVRVEEKDGRLDLDAVLKDLGGQGARSVLVEGGGRTVAGFVEAGVTARVVLFVAPTLIGARGATPFLDRDAVVDPTGGWHVDELRRIPLGHDLVLSGVLRART